jgi:Chromosome segregation ATPases
MTRKIQEYELGEDFLEIRDSVKGILFSKENELNREKLQLEQAHGKAQESFEELNAELESWNNKKDPEPEQPECVRQNRRRLKEQGIPYQQFYKIIEFDTGLTIEQADRIEEALMNMGVLDALIISEEYREQVYSLDPGVCDKYIFSDVSHVKENLTQVLDVDNGEQDILLYHSISNILSAIGFGSREEQSGHSWIDREGNYRIGVLEGTVTKEYKARFIGARAREEYRKSKIEELTVLCEQEEKEIRMLEEAIVQNEERRNRLQREWLEFPKEDDLKTAAKALAECEYKLEISVRQLGEQQIITEKERKNLDQIRIKVRELCSKAYLTPRLELFVQTLDGLRNYKELLASLQVLWGNYQNGLRFVESQEAYLEELEQDLDEIRYERIRIQQKIRELEGLLDSVRKQLELTDYEQIQERLDFCMKRLLQLPKERENSVREQEALEGEIQTLEEKIKENGIKKQEFLKKQEKYQYIFQKEYNLGYVEKNFVITEDMDDQARKVCRMFAGGFGNKKQSDLFGNLQEIYHQNRGYLLDYQITLLSLFGDLDEDSLFYEKSVKRIDISAKYRGISVTFKELIRKLTEDAESLSALLNERDRELFEDILANTISKKIRIKIQASRRWIEKMNTLMESMQTSSGLKLSLRWKNKQAQREDQLDTRSLVELLQKDAEIMREEEVESLSRHFRSKIEEARKISGETGAVQSFHATMREVLDYRKWFEFQLECQKTGEKKRELTDRVFFTFSGGEKAMSMYVPLFSAVVAKYAGANEDAPRLISLDEAFAGVDETNIRDMFRLMVEFEFNFMINSQILWGDYDTVPGLAIYQLIRPENAKFVSVIRYIWNGKKKIMTTGSTEQRS